MKNIFIILGHSNTDTFSGSLADRYESGARESGHEVRRVNLGDLSFDPILHRGYKEIQELEPDLVKIQKNISWADHIVIIYPNWWNTMPAILKGMFDRTFLPNFAFSIDGKSKSARPLLKGKSARVIISSGTYYPFVIRIRFGDYTNEISKGILGFCGIAPVRITSFGPTEYVTEQKKDQWKQKIHNLGKEGI